uniref:Uncharacterized protein n=1 Tax=Athene cunicularia TaxID=194338 RepID=A0A663LVR0_ATHCN
VCLTQRKWEELLVTFALLFLLKMSETRKIPPGPFPLPVIGNMLQLKSNLPEASGCNLKAMFFFGNLYQLSKKYGPVIAICLVSVHAVVLYGTLYYEISSD